MVDAVAVAEHVHLQATIVAQLPVEQSPVRYGAVGHAAYAASHASPVPFPGALRIGHAGHLAEIEIAGGRARGSAGIGADPTTALALESLVHIVEAANATIGADLVTYRPHQFIESFRMGHGHLATAQDRDSLELF